jgi:hypothetical protein
MVTASHNDDGWTGLKVGANRPLTFGPDAAASQPSHPPEDLPEHDADSRDA